MEADKKSGKKETYLHGPELRTALPDLHLTCIGVRVTLLTEYSNDHNFQTIYPI